MQKGAKGDAVTKDRSRKKSFWDCSQCEGYGFILATRTTSGSALLRDEWRVLSGILGSRRHLGCAPPCEHRNSDVKVFRNVLDGARDSIPKLGRLVGRSSFYGVDFIVGCRSFVAPDSVSRKLLGRLGAASEFCRMGSKRMSSIGRQHCVQDSCGSTAWTNQKGELFLGLRCYVEAHKGVTPLLVVDVDVQWNHIGDGPVQPFCESIRLRWYAVALRLSVYVVL